MKLPITRPSLPVVVTSLTRPAAAKPTVITSPATKSGQVPKEIIQSVLEAEYNNGLKSKAGARYDALRAEINAWMLKNKVTSFTAKGLYANRGWTVFVSLEDTSKSRVDLDKLLEYTGLTLAQLHEKGILSSSAKAITDALGAQAAQQATVPGKPNVQAKFKELP